LCSFRDHTGSQWVIMEAKSQLQTKIFRKIEEIPPQEWLSVFPGVLENYYFFKALDESGFDQFSFFYIIVYDNGVPVGATSCFLMDFPFDIMVNGALKTILTFVKKILPNILSPRVLICGLPMSQGRIGMVGLSALVMEAIYGCMEKIAQDELAAVLMFKDFACTYDSVFEPFLKKGFLKIESLPSTIMDIDFADFDGYLKTLSPVSRQDIKRKFKKIDGRVKIDLEVTNAPDDSALSEIYRLYLQTFDKQDMGMEKLTPDFFKHISRNMPQEAKYFLWRIEGKLVAFALCFVSKEYFIDYYLGFDYSVAYQYYLYFVRFRDLMKWCIARGIKKYEMGSTTYEPKRRLGFDFIRLYFYMKHRNKLINPFIGIVSRFIKPENFDPVFKEMKKAGNSSPAAS